MQSNGTQSLSLLSTYEHIQRVDIDIQSHHQFYSNPYSDN